MEFDEEHEEEQEEEMEEEMPTQQHQLGTNSGSALLRMRPNSGEGGLTVRKSGTGTTTAPPTTIRYRECLKNHAVSIGGHAVDGCGEFIAAGEEGTLDALKCAACNCHRNFHRKEIDSPDQTGATNHHSLQPYYHHHQSFAPPYYRGPPLQPPPSGYLHMSSPPGHQRPLALPSASGGRDEEGMSNPSSSGGGGGGSSKKRFRTKFSQEQKEKMLAFAERVGWRIQKHDEAAVEQFCAEAGVNRHVLKVWMHNNKHTLGKKP